MIEKIFDVEHIIDKDRLVLIEQAKLLDLDWFHATAVCELLRLDRPIRNAARSALRYLQRGHLLHESMPELAYFCLLTAEEEAATALFHALKQRKYQGAERLDVRDHRHKSAVWPFLQSVGSALSLIEPHFAPKLEFQEDEVTLRQVLKSRVTIRLPDGEEKWAYPEPPLNFDLRLNGEPHPFEREMGELSASANVKNIQRLITHRSNERNRTIYAAQTGIPHVTIPMADLRARQGIVFMEFFVLLLVAQVVEHQPFVQHSLDVFLDVLDQLRLRTKD